MSRAPVSGLLHSSRRIGASDGLAAVGTPPSTAPARYHLTSDYALALAISAGFPRRRLDRRRLIAAALPRTTPADPLKPRRLEPEKWH